MALNLCVPGKLISCGMMAELPLPSSISQYNSVSPNELEAPSMTDTIQQPDIHGNRPSPLVDPASCSP